MVRIRGFDQLGESSVEDARDLLRALTTTLGELLGQFREPGDVGKDERALERARERVRCVAEPVGRKAGNERAQWIVR